MNTGKTTRQIGNVKVNRAHGVSRDNFHTFFTESVLPNIGMKHTLRLVKAMCKEQVPVPASACSECTLYSDEVLRIFTLLDCDEDMFLREEELKSVWGSSATAMVKSYDTDHNGTISVEEWIDWWAKASREQGDRVEL